MANRIGRGALWLLGFLLLAPQAQAKPPWFVATADSLYLTVPSEVKWEDRKYPVRIRDLADMGLGRAFGNAIGSNLTYMPLYVCVKLHPKAPFSFIFGPDSVSATRRGRTVKAAGWDLTTSTAVIHAGEDDCFIFFFPLQSLDESVEKVTVYSMGKVYRLEKKGKL